MKSLFIVLLAFAIINQSSSLSLRKETDTAKSLEKSQSKVTYSTVEIAEPTTVEQQIHEGEPFTPEYAYPNEQRFKEKSNNQAKYDNYINPQIVQSEHPVENGYFSPEIVHRFKETDASKKTEQKVIKYKYDDYISPEIKIDEHPVENGYFTPEIVHRFKEKAVTNAVTNSKTTQPPYPAKSPQTTEPKVYKYPLQSQQIPLEDLNKGLDEKSQFVDTAKAGISDYAKEDLARINAGYPKQLPSKREEMQDYGSTPEIYHHIVQESITKIQTAKSEGTEDKKALWHEFIPKDGRRYGDIIYNKDPQNVEPVYTMTDAQGKPRDYYANILNYVTPVKVDDTKAPHYQDQNPLTNVHNPIKSTMQERTYDKEVKTFDEK